MKQRLFLLILVAIGCLMFLAVGTLTAKDKPKEAPPEILIDNKGYKKDRYGAVKFNHKKHQDEYKNSEGNIIDCAECHHVYDDKAKNTWKDDDPVQKCVECHDPLKSDPKNKKNKKLQLAFHNNCKNCHKKVVKAGLKKEKEAPSKKCITCMGKKKK